MDSHNFDISNAAPPPSVQHALRDDQQPNQAERDAFEQQLDAARVAAGLARRPGRKPPSNVSRADHDYIQAMMSGISTRRNLAPLTADKYVQMLYKVANYLGERGPSRSKPVMTMLRLDRSKCFQFRFPAAFSGGAWSTAR